jgi:cell division transport system permease protein
MIGRWLHRMRYFCDDAWDEWRHSKAVNLLALGTIAAVLFVAGVAMLVLSNVERRVVALRDEVRVTIYLTAAMADDERRDLMRELGQAPEVRRVEFVSPREALRRYRTWAADMAELAAELETNPLPASLDVFLRPETPAAQAAAAITARVERRPGVEEVRFNQAWLERVESLIALARAGGGALAVVIFGAVVLVVAGVLRLAVHARRDEIEIMRLVGATPGLIRGPFLVAGAAQGLIASVAALAVVEGVRSAALAWTGSGSLPLVGLVADRPLQAGLALILVLVGLLVGLTASWFSVRPEA